MDQSTAPVQGHELWSFTNALFFIILLVIVFVLAAVGIQSSSQLQNIRDNWADHRCNPLIMPFAGWFGHNAKDNFDFCMGKIFNTHSQSYIGSLTSIFTQFSIVLQSIFQSVNSLRNTIASLGGGINVIMQEFTERISMFFFKLRVSAIYMKSLFMRMYALLFSVMYMGMSGITGMTSFTNTFLFSFLDTFCFPEETPIRVKNRGTIPIAEVQIGDVLLPGNARVTATFQFEARGQPMVQVGPVKVSTNHYMDYKGRMIRAGDHPHAIALGPWTSEKYLYCLNTDTHRIPVAYLTFMDYDETSSADEQTMRWVEHKINSSPIETNRPYPFTECGFTMSPEGGVRMKDGTSRRAAELRIGDLLSTGATIAGVIRKDTTEYISHGITKLSPSTLYWNSGTQQWKRVGEEHMVQHLSHPAPFVSFVVTPNSIIELEDGTMIRDYMEVCSPDTEQYYAKQIENDNSLLH